jgi:cyclopropane-fatty-acyl-phospholipid synthase
LRTVINPNVCRNHDVRAHVEAWVSSARHANGLSGGIDGLVAAQRIRHGSCPSQFPPEARAGAHMIIRSLEQTLRNRIDGIRPSLAVVLPGGGRIGAKDSAVTLVLRDAAVLAALALGRVGNVAEAYVEKRIDLEGSMRDIGAAAAGLLGGDPTQPDARSAGLRNWWREVLHRSRWNSGTSAPSAPRHERIGAAVRADARHTPAVDAKQVQFHYDLDGAGGNEFYGLWLDPMRVYSCAYWPGPGMTLEEAQAAKLEHICRKLMLRPGERLLDIGAGWGALLFWAAEHHGVRAHGVTLSKNQHAWVQQQIERRGLEGRVSMELLDYRSIDEREPFDKIASVGMFEHVGLANLPVYFGKVRRLLAPGGLLMNHGITAGGTRNTQLGGGIGDFVERYIFPGGELVHVSVVMAAMAEAGLEAVDVENLRPHYARTLWAWSDAFEANIDRARELSSEDVVRAYRLYLAGSAMAFERGWIGLHQIVGTRPTGDVTTGTMRGAQSSYPFNREHLHRRAP